MKLLAATVLLGPVLVWQGRRVRRTALELPEAAGPREGRSAAVQDEAAVSEAPVFRLRVMGDSAAAGVGVAHQDQALTGCLVRALSAQQTVEWRLEARTGRRLSDVVRSVERHAPAEPAGASLDLVVVSAGINDVLQGTSVSQWREGLQRLADGLEQRHGARRVAFSGIPRIEDFPLLPQPLAGYLGLRARRLNAATQAFMQADAPGSWRFVNLDAPLEPAHLAVDGFHPNELSCRVWCDAVLDAIRA